jgi:hypothetical protein
VRSRHRNIREAAFVRSEHKTAGQTHNYTAPHA